MSKTFAYQLHHKMGGVCRPPEVTCCDRYLDREERYELARLREAGLSMRQIAVRTGRSPSTISRELRRNADPRTGQYQPERPGGWRGNGSGGPAVPAVGQPGAAGRGAAPAGPPVLPEQASGRLKIMHPGDAAMHVSHETIYQSIYLYPRGELRRELKACLRSGRDVRKRRGRREARGRSSARSRSGSARPRPRAAWSPATTKATSSWARRHRTPPSGPSSSG